MAKRLQHRGGTTSQHSTFTGAVREVTVDTDKNTLVVHDGATAGGHPLATATNFTSTGIDDNATSTAITIDSSERVGIGISNPTSPLHIKNASNPKFHVITASPTASYNAGFLVSAGNSASPSTRFVTLALDADGGDGSGSDNFTIKKIGGSPGNVELTQEGSANILFKTADTERMRIRSDGNVLIGKTSLDYESTAGHILRGDGLINCTRSNGNVTDFNRLSSDGEVLRISKDGTTVGSINAEGGDIAIGTGTVGFQFYDGGNAIRPFSITANHWIDNTIDIGRGVNRFKDLYLGGGLYVGGTGSGNKLDDYEEGTFTPGLDSYAGTPSITSAYYTKIGRMVYGGFALTLDGTSDASSFRITGFPFTISDNIWGGSVVYTNSATTENIYPLFNLGNMNLYLYKTSGSAHTYNGFGNDKNIRIIFMYQTA